MNDFAHLAEHHLLQHDDIGLVDLSLCSRQCRAAPLYKSHVSRDQARRSSAQQPHRSTVTRVPGFADS